MRPPSALTWNWKARSRAIDRAARLLGYARNDYMTDTYGSLYLAACRRRGQQTRRHALSDNKKIALTLTLSLTKI